MCSSNAESIELNIYARSFDLRSWTKNWESKDAEPWQQPGEVESRSHQETHTRTKEAVPKTPRSTTT